MGCREDFRNGSTEFVNGEVMRSLQLIVVKE